MENESECGKDACYAGGKGCSESQCGCGQGGNCSCNEKGCSDNGCGSGGCAPCPSEWCGCMGCKLTMLARKAKMKVLMRKMEEHIEKEIGKKLDLKAKIAVEHLLKMWKLENEGEEAQQAELDDYSKKLDEAMKE